MQMVQFELDFDEDGSLHDVSQVSRIVAGLENVSDLAIVVHGWSNDREEAASFVDAIVRSVQSVIDAGFIPLADRRLGVVRVFWPSRKLVDVDAVFNGRAAAGRQYQELLLDLLAGLATDSSRRSLIERAKELVPHFELGDARREFVQCIRATLSSDDADEEDGSSYFFTADPEMLFENLGRPFAVPGDEPGGAIGVLEPIPDRDPLAAAIRLTNFASYYQVKRRADNIGRAGLGPFVRRIRHAYPRAAVHFIGHSFGGRLVASAATTLPPGSHAITLTLLQATISHHGFADRFDTRHDGAFRTVLRDRRVSGPVLIVHSANDRLALTLLSPGGGAAGLGDADDRGSPTSLARNGAQGTPEAEGRGGTLGPVGYAYNFEPGGLFNLRADSFVRDHGDVTGVEVAYAFLTALSSQASTAPAGVTSPSRRPDVSGLPPEAEDDRGRDLLPGAGTNTSTLEPPTPGRATAAAGTTTGTIKRIASNKGFGFIATDEGNEYFFHQSAYAGKRFDDLQEGQSVRFTVNQGPKGPRADDVTIVWDDVARTDPPRSGHARLDCPDVVTATLEFQVILGLAAEPSPNVIGGPFVRPPTSHGPYDLTVQIVAPGFSLRSGENARNVLPVTAAAPWPSVVLHLTATPQADEVKPATVQAIFSVDGQTIGFAVRALVVRATADRVVPTVVQPAGSVDMTVPSSQTAPDLTVRISADPAVAGRLLWTFETRFAAIDVPDEAIEVHIGGESQQFARQLVDRVNAKEGQAGLSVYLRGIGREIAEKVPAEFWLLLRRAHEVTTEIPTVLILSQEPHVPWELALMDDPLIDPDAPPFLAAQVTVGRWVLRHGAKLPPPVDSAADRLAIVWGEYKGPRWRRLLEAEAEAGHLKATYGAVDVKATMTEVLECLEGTPPADLLHFAVHGVYDPGGVQDGLALVDGTFLEPLHISGVRMHGAPFVFLNACQVGSGSRILGDYAGMAAAFLSAGAVGVIAPLWSVKDTIAREIAERFYHQVFAGVPPAEAMRVARAGVPMSGQTPSATGLAYQFFGHPSLRLHR